MLVSVTLLSDAFAQKPVLLTEKLTDQARPVVTIDEEPTREVASSETQEPALTSEQKLEKKVDERFEELEHQIYMQGKRLEGLFLRMSFLTFTGILMGVMAGFWISRREKQTNISRVVEKTTQKSVNQAEQLAFEAKLLHINTLIENYKNRAV